MFFGSGRFSISSRNHLFALPVLTLLCFSSQAFAVKRVTVDRLQQILDAAHGRSDDKVATQLLDLELTERASFTRVATWEAWLPGHRSREALIALTDPSAFLDLPDADTPATPPPDVAEQNHILTRTVTYVANFIHSLPNFQATRETTYFEDTPSRETSSMDMVNGVSLTPYVPLRVVATSSTQVTYRGGREVLAAEPAKGAKPHLDRLSSTGEFGPMLAIVVGDATRGLITWAHWQQGPSGPQAVLRYTVPQAKSRYKVMSACEAVPATWMSPAYHGEIAVDPASGAVLRLTVITDMPPACQVAGVKNLVEYGSVQIGGQTRICPMKSASILSFRLRSGKGAEADIQTQLNDVSFSQYHLFSSDIRIVQEDEARAVAPAAASPDASAHNRFQQNQAPPQAGPAPDPNSTAAAIASPLSNSARQVASDPSTNTTAAAQPPPVQPSLTQSAPSPPAPTETTPRANTPQPESTSLPPDSIPLIRTNANLVLVDVVVTDKGAPVHNLDQSRFRISQDGHDQPITSFEEHQPAPTQAAPATAAVQQPLPPHTFTNTPRYPPSSALNILLLDALNTPVENQAQMRAQVVEYLAKAGPSAPFAIFTLTSRLQLVKGFTTDPAALLSAVKNPTTGAQQSSLLDNQDQLSLNPNANELTNGGRQIALIKQALSQVAAEQADTRVRITLDALNLLAAYLGGIPGRKNLIWLSGSFPISLDPNDQLIDPMRSARRFTQEVRQTDERLASARVAVYPIDARGVMTQTSADASYRSAPNLAYGRVNLPQPAQEDKNFQIQTQNENATMRTIADGTGGKAFIHDNNLKAAVESALNDGSSYYTVGYVPPADPPDGKFHKIQVHLDGKNLNASYRSGYFEKPARKAYSDDSSAKSIMASVTAYGAPPATQVLFTTRVLDAADPLLKSADLTGPAGDMEGSIKAPLHRYVAELTIDPHSVTFTDLPDGKRELHLESGIVVYDADGKRLNYLDRTIALKLDPAQLAHMMSDGVRLRMLIAAPAGNLTLRIAVQDLATARTGSLEVATPGSNR